MFFAIALIFAQQSSDQIASIPSLEEASKQIEASDAELFWAAFEGCKPRALEPLLTEDFRMLHDLAGLAVASRKQFLDRMQKQCRDREEDGPTPGYKNRRLLVPGSRTVTPLGNWGVLDRGYHTFHEFRGDKGWVQTGGARYIHVWRWMTEEARFRLQESISVDHGAAGRYPPARE